MRKTLLIVIDQLGVGGTEKQLSQLLPRVDNKTYKIIVYAFFSKGACSEELLKNNISVVSPPFFRAFSRLGFLGKGLLTILSISKLSLIVFFNKPAIVHYYLPRSYLLGSLCAFLTPKSKLLMSRRSLNDYQKKYPRLALLERRLHKKMSLVLSNSKAISKQLLEEGVSKRQLRTIYNGVDLERFERVGSTSALRTSLAISENALVFIIVANLFFYKGHADLLQALDLAKNKLPREWNLLCVGRDAGQKEKLLQLTSRYKLEDYVQWLGERNDIPELLAISDIALLTSHQEGFSNSILEAMAAKLPVIVTDVGGNSEAVVEGKTGLIVPAKNPDALAKALVTLSSDKALQKNMGTLGFQRVQECFSLDACAKQYEAIYSEAMDCAACD